MRTAIVKYRNGTVINTSINGTDAQIHEYFKPGRMFNLGKGEHDNLQAVESCQIVPESYRDLPESTVEKYADKNGLNIETRENYREAAIECFNEMCGEKQSQPTKKTLKRFPNGFRSWMETHHEVVSFITHKSIPEATDLLLEIQEAQGMCGFYELAEEWTDEFEKLNKGREWDGEYYDEVDEFCEKKLSQ